jgi:cell division protein FtsB
VGVRQLLWIPALLGAALVYSAFDGDSGLRTWLRLKLELRSAHSRIAGTRSEIEGLQRDAQGLRHDSFSIERAIREGLEYARPGEVVVRLPRSDLPNTRIP